MSDLLQTYLEGPTLLRQAVAGMTSEQAMARPVAGKMSTLEVVCHLADFEPIIADRIKRTLAMERPTLLGADENRFLEKLAYHHRDLQEELNLIEVTRSQLSRILRAAPAGALQRVGIHSERGELTAEKLLQLACNHIPHHVKY
ncbi:MAG: DinB family protein, partial [Gemmataceae bacterium]